MAFAQPETWNESASDYDSFEKTWNFYGRIADAMIRELAIRDDWRVLELACGTGACTVRLASAIPSGKLVALDFSGPMLRVARANVAAAGLSNVTFVQADAMEVAALFAGQSFDLAVCNAAFWHFPDPARVLDGLRGLLTTSGELGISLPRIAISGDARGDVAREKAKEILFKHGVSSRELSRSTRHRRTVVDMPPLLRERAFAVKDVWIRIPMPPGMRKEWRRIQAFSDESRRWWAVPGLDPKVQAEVRDEFEAWRRSTFPDDQSSVSWVLYISRMLPGSSPA